MKISSVSNQTSAVNFASFEDDKKELIRKRKKAFVSLNDDQIRTLAYVSTYNKPQDKSKKAMLSTLYAIPVVGTLSAGVLKNGSLGKKIIATGKAGAGWVAALAMLDIFYKAKKDVVKNSETAQRFENNHPVASLILDLGLFTAGLTAGFRGLQKLGTVIAKKAPQLAEFKNTAVKTIEEHADNTGLNKVGLPKINKGLEKLYNVAPWAVNAGFSVVANSVWIVAIAGMLRSASIAKQKREKFEENYAYLKETQLAVAKNLSKELAKESAKAKFEAEKQKEIRTAVENAVKEIKKQTEADKEEVVKSTKAAKAEKVEDESTDVAEIKEVKEPKKASTSKEEEKEEKEV